MDIKTVEKDQGLHRRNVDRVVRDGNGYFYLLMSDAVQRYDGSSFEYVDISILREKGEKLRGITQAEQLSDGTVCFTGPTLKHLYYIPPTELKIKAKPNQGTTLWGSGYLFEVRKSDDISRYSVFQKENINDEYEQAFDSKHNITSITFSEGQYHTNDDEENIYFHIDGRSDQLNIRGRIIANPRGTYVWSTDGIWKLDGTDYEKIQEISLPKTYNLKKEILPKWITNIKADKKGNLICTFTDKRQFQRDVLVYTTKDTLLNYSDSLLIQTNVFKDFWTDDATFRWITAGFNALNIFSFVRDGAKIHNRQLGVRKNAFGRVMTAVTTDSKGRVFTIREPKGVFRLVDDSLVSVFDTTLYKTHFINNTRLHASGYDDYLYSGSYRFDTFSLIYQIDPDKGKFIERHIPFKYMDFVPIANNEILIAGFDDSDKSGILARYNFATSKLDYLRTDITRGRSIYWDEKENRYWLGTENGIHVLDSNFKDIAILSDDQKGDRHIPSDLIVTSVPHNGNMLCGSYGSGLFVIGRKDFNVKQILNDTTGLTDNDVIGIIKTDDGNTLLTTFNGVNILDDSLNVIKQIYDHQGLCSREFNTKAITKDFEGNIYAGTINGLMGMNPRKMLLWEHSNGLNISSVEAYEKRKTTTITDPRVANITTSFDSLVINLASPDYFHFPYKENNILYDVMHEDKVDLYTDPNKIVFKDMKSRKYDIEISSPNIDASTQYTIIRKKSFKWLFPLLIIGGLLGLLSFFIIRYLTGKEKEKAELSKEISALQLTSLQSQMNPHFIFNALGAVQYFIQTHEAEKADEYLSNFAMLMRGILESSKSKYISLKNEIDLLELYVGLEAIRFEDKFDYEFIFDDELDIDMNMPPMIIQPYLENAINHGIYNLSTRRGKLTIRFDQVDDNTFSCIITDNGVGRERAQELRTKRHKSRGMQIVKERISTINNSEDLRVDTKTEDVIVDGNVAGTRVEIFVHEPD